MSCQEACKFYLIESGFALMVAFLINVSVISVSGAVCSSPDLKPDEVQRCSDLDLNEASFSLKNVLGNWSSKLFAIALLASGQSSTITGTYAGQYVMQGFLDLRLKPWIRNSLTRCLAIAPSLVVAIVGGSAGAGNLIIIASMILIVELPFALIPLLKFTSSKTKMGLYANSVSQKTSTKLIEFRNTNKEKSISTDMGGGRMIRKEDDDKGILSAQLCRKCDKQTGMHLESKEREARNSADVNHDVTLTQML